MAGATNRGIRLCLTPLPSLRVPVFLDGGLWSIALTDGPGATAAESKSVEPADQFISAGA